MIVIINIIYISMWVPGKTTQVHFSQIWVYLIFLCLNTPVLRGKVEINENVKKLARDNSKCKRLKFTFYTSITF